MKNRLFTLVLVIFTFLALPAAHAQQNSEVVALEPVMIIRFNQPQIDFANQLAEVVQRAIQMKPNVKFDLIQYVPPHAQNETAILKQHSDAVVMTMFQNGLNPQQLRFMQMVSADVPTDEIYIFVQ